MRTALLLVFVAACSSGSSAKQSRIVDDGEARKLLLDRNWLTEMPETERDHFHVYRFVPSMGGGVFQDRTAFRGQFELFAFHTKDDLLELHLPHTGDNALLHYKIERVKHGVFDLRLTIEHNPRGPDVYYSVEEQRGTTEAELDAQLAR